MKENSMDRTEATKLLAQAGRAGEAVEILQSKKRQYEGAYEAIQSNPDLTDTAKQSRQAAQYLSAMADVEKALVSQASRVQLVDHDDASNIFGTKGLDGDPASLAISRRDAADRVAACQNWDERRELLARATRSGDEVLARAVVEHAVTHQDAKTANQYLETRPQHEAGLKRLWEIEAGGDSQAQFAISLAIHGLRPAALSGLASLDIERLANPVPR
jgi:hypothetical protein